ncbi:hypothetical protein KDL45_04590, partial [bacterium]|nr:hypothetical protein [bacterium]
NNGAKIARGEIYLFAEADGYYDDDYVEKIIRYLHLPGVAAGINVGRRVWTDRDNVLVRHQNDLLQAAADRVRAGKRGTGGWAFPKGVFWAVNGYDPECRIGQDVDLVRRVVEAVGRTVLGGESVLYHKDPDTLRTYMKRAHRGAYFSGRFREKWHGGAGLVKKLAYTAKFAALAAWPLYVIPALGVHPIFWLPFAAVPAYLLFEDLTTWDGWRLTWRRGDVATALATPVLLYLRRLAIGVGRLRSFFA